MNQKYWNIITAIALLAVIAAGLRHLAGSHGGEQPEQLPAEMPGETDNGPDTADNEELLMDLDAEPAPRVLIADSAYRDSTETADSLHHAAPADSLDSAPAEMPGTDAGTQPHETPAQHQPTDSVG